MLVVLWVTMVLLRNCVPCYQLESKHLILGFGEGVIAHNISRVNLGSAQLGLSYSIPVPSLQIFVSQNLDFISKTCALISTQLFVDELFTDISRLEYFPSPQYL
jgi:hypothetical protein